MIRLGCWKKSNTISWKISCCKCIYGYICGVKSYCMTYGKRGAYSSELFFFLRSFSRAALWCCSTRTSRHLLRRTSTPHSVWKKLFISRVVFHLLPKSPLGIGKPAREQCCCTSWPRGVHVNRFGTSWQRVNCK